MSSNQQDYEDNSIFGPDHDSSDLDSDFLPFAPAKPNPFDPTDQARYEAEMTIYNRQQNLPRKYRDYTIEQLDEEIEYYQGMARKKDAAQQRSGEGKVVWLKRLKRNFVKATRAEYDRNSQ